MKERKQGLRMGCTRLVAFLLLGYLSLLGLSEGCAGLNRAGAAADSVNWPTTTGEVFDSIPTDIWVPGSTSIGYLYYVDDEKYLSPYLSFGSRTLPPELEDGAARLARFPVGTKVTVYYDPRNPNYAVIYPGNGYSLLEIVGLVLFSLAGVITGLAALTLVDREDR